MVYLSLEYSISGFKKKISDVLKAVLTDKAMSRYNMGVLSRNNVNINDIKPEAQTKEILGKIQTKLAVNADQRKTNEYQLLCGVKNQIEKKISPNKEQRLQQQIDNRIKFHNINDSMSLSQLLNNGQDNTHTITKSQVDKRVQFNNGITTYGNKTVKAQLDINQNSIAQSTHILQDGEMANNESYPEPLLKIIEDDKDYLQNNGQFYERNSGVGLYQTHSHVKSVQYKLDKLLPTQGQDNNDKKQLQHVYEDKREDNNDTRDNTAHQHEDSHSNDEYIIIEDDKNINEEQIGISYIQQDEQDEQKSLQVNPMEQVQVEESLGIEHSDIDSNIQQSSELHDDENTDNKIARLKDEVEYTHNRLAETNDENMKLTQRFNNLQKEYNELVAKDKNYEQMHDERDTALKENVDLKNQNWEYEQQVDRLQIQNQNLEREKEELERKKDEIDSKNYVLIQRNDLVEAGNRALQNENDVLKTQVEQLHKRNSSLEKYITEACDEREKVEDENKQLKDNNNQLQNDTESLRTKVAEREEDLAGLRRERDRLNKTIAGQQETISSQQRTIERSEKTKQRQNNEIGKLNKNLRNVKNKNDTLKKKNEKIAIENGTLKLEVEELKMKNERLTKQDRKLQELIETQRKAVTNVRAINKKINNELQEALKKLEAFENKNFYILH